MRKIKIAKKNWSLLYKPEFVQGKCKNLFEEKILDHSTIHYAIFSTCFSIHDDREIRKGGDAAAFLRGAREARSLPSRSRKVPTRF